MLPRKHRVTGAQLTRTLPQSRSYPSDWGVLRINHNNAQVQIACIVSKKVSKSSPERHRIKRRLYSMLRPLISELQPGYYYLFPNKISLTLDHQSLEQTLLNSFDRFLQTHS